MSKIPVFQKDAKGKIIRRVVPDSELAHLPRASLLRRLAALLYDMFLVLSIWFLCQYALLFIYGLFAPNTSELIDGQVYTPPLLSALTYVMMVSTAVYF